MKQLLILLTLAITSTTFASASSPFHSLIVEKRSNHMEVSVKAPLPLEKKFFFALRASKAGNFQAKYDLAMMYALGQGVQKDARKAFNLFHEAARKAHVKAKYCMGVNFEKGLGVKAQPELARYWFKLAAKAGDTQATVKLADIKKIIKKMRGRQLVASVR